LGPINIREERIMSNVLRRFAWVTAGLLALGVSTRSARADFEILVMESGGPTIPIVDDGPLDINTTDPGVITVNTPALNALLTNFAFGSLGADSNRTTGTPFSNDPASLSQTGEVGRATLAGTFSISIVAFDTDYLFPSGNPKVMTTSASDTFRFTTAGDLRTFQSFFDPTNTTPPGGGIPSPLLAFVPPVGTGPFGTTSPGVVTPLGIQPIPFGLSNVTIITLGPSASLSSAQRDQFSGATSVTAVPEPGSVGLFALGLGCLACRGLRRQLRRACTS